MTPDLGLHRERESGNSGDRARPPRPVCTRLPETRSRSLDIAPKRARIIKMRSHAGLAYRRR